MFSRYCADELTTAWHARGACQIGFPGAAEFVGGRFAQIIVKGA